MGASSSSSDASSSVPSESESPRTTPSAPGPRWLSPSSASSVHSRWRSAAVCVEDRSERRTVASRALRSWRRAAAADASARARTYLETAAAPGGADDGGAPSAAAPRTKSLEHFLAGRAAANARRAAASAWSRTRKRRAARSAGRPPHFMPRVTSAALTPSAPIASSRAGGEAWCDRSSQPSSWSWPLSVADRRCASLTSAASIVQQLAQDVLRLFASVQ
mmetsp:Transcript_23164/g.46234  ORF Transcript_23164/g.46234 Transcript_23164/m.46234 type:complete len:220 (-) Transcript_23164:441-1100(-)